MRYSKYSVLHLFFIITGLLIITTSCDSPISSTDPAPKPLLDIPLHGPSALPGVVGKDGDPTVQASHDAPPAYQILEKYAEDNPDNPFIAVTGIWNAEEERYAYKAIPIEFSDEITNKANGETKYYWYRLNGSESGIIRNAVALIPATPKARNMMTAWLQVKDRDKVVA